MKQRIFLLLVLMAVFVLSPLKAQTGLSANERLLGYTVTDSITYDSVAFGKAGTYTVGALISQNQLASYRGCHIVGMRIAVAANLGRSRMFVNSVDGSSFNELFSQNQRLYRGWNTVYFNAEGYEITGNENLFFGFDYVETAEMVSEEMGGLCCFATTATDGFYVYGNFGQGEGLYPVSEGFALCIQLIIDVSSLPRYDLNATYLDTGFKHKKPGEVIDVFSTFTSVGRDTVSTYRFGYQLDNLEPVIMTRVKKLVSGESNDEQFNVPLPEDLAIGRHHLSVFVVDVENQPIKSSASDTLTAEFAIYRDSLQRHYAYMEVYHDQSSVFQSLLNNAISEMKKKTDNTIVVNIPKPSTSLYVDGSSYLHDFYAYTHPTFTVNRAYFPGEAYIAYDMNDYLPFFTPDMCAGILSGLVMQDYYNPTFANVELTSDYDPTTGDITVNVTGKALPEAEAMYDNIGVTLMVVEDSVVAQQSVVNEITGYAAINRQYIHNDVLRQYLSAPMGDKLTIAADGTFTHSVKTVLANGIRPRNARVIAIVAKHITDAASANTHDLDILDVNEVPVSIQLGVNPLHAGSAADSDASRMMMPTYNLNGSRVGNSSARKGIYIRRSSDGTARKIVVR